MSSLLNANAATAAVPTLPATTTTTTTLQSARETMDILHEMSQLLNCGLDRESLALCVSLIESGVNPEALSVTLLEAKRAAKAATAAVTTTTTTTAATTKSS